MDTKKRYQMACFVHAKPSDPDGWGDSTSTFDDLDEATKWAEKAIKAGRFKYLALWEDIGSDWERVDEWSAAKPSN